MSGETSDRFRIHPLARHDPAFAFDTYLATALILHLHCLYTLEA